ncbi:MAG: hypothetical protein ABTD50_15755 [Polyangiaceae bacterium]
MDAHWERSAGPELPDELLFREQLRLAALDLLDSARELPVPGAFPVGVAQRLGNVKFVAQLVALGLVELGH